MTITSVLKEFEVSRLIILEHVVKHHSRYMHNERPRPRRGAHDTKRHPQLLETVQQPSADGGAPAPRMGHGAVEHGPTKYTKSRTPLSVCTRQMVSRAGPAAQQRAAAATHLEPP